MQLEEMKLDPDPNTRRDLEAARTRFTAMLDDLQTQLETVWTQWDAALDAEASAGSNVTAAKDGAKQAMVALLNRRSYVRNLVRDVNAALE